MWVDTTVLLLLLTLIWFCVSSQDFFFQDRTVNIAVKFIQDFGWMLMFPVSAGSVNRQMLTGQQEYQKTLLAMQRLFPAFKWNSYINLTTHLQDLGYYDAKLTMGETECTFLYLVAQPKVNLFSCIIFD